MAERKISFEDIFQEDIFQRIAVSAKAFDDILGELDKTIARVGPKLAQSLREATQATPSAEALKKLSDNLREADRITRTLTGARDQLAKASQKLKDLEGAQAAELAKIKLAIRERTKDLAAQARSAEAAAQKEQLLAAAERGVFESYEALNETLGKLRIVYKDLAAQGKANTEEALRLAAAIGRLDREAKRIDERVGQFQRNVGNYANSIREVFAEFRAEAGKAGGQVGGISNALFTIGDAFRAAGGGLKGLAAGTKALGQSLKSLGILALLSLLAEGIDKVTGKIKDVFSKEGRRALEDAEEALELTRKRIAAEDAVAEIKRAAALEEERTLERVRAEFAARRKVLEVDLQRAEAELRIAQRARELANSKEEEASAIREVANAEAQVAEVRRALRELDSERLKTEKEIQKAAQRAAEERQREEEEARRRRAEAEAQRKEELAQLLKALELEKERGKTRVEQAELDARQAEESARRTAAEALRLARTAQERVAVEEALARKLEEIERNKQLKIADIRAEAEAKAAQIAAQLRDKSTEAELLGIREKYQRVLEEVAAQEKELGKELTEIRQAAAEAEQRERQALLRRAAMAQIEFREQMAMAELDAEAASFATREEFEKYKQKRLQELQLQFLRERMASLQQFSGAEVELERKKLQAQIALLELQARDIERGAQSIAQRMQEVAKNVGDVVDVVVALLERQMSRASMLIDRQLGQIRLRQEALVAQIAAGNVNAQQSLAELEAREAELIRQQEALKRQAQRREAALAIFRAYAGQLQQGVNPAQALVNVIRDFQLLSQLIRTLPTFYHGAEYISTATHPKVLSSTRDAFLARVHEGERIVPARINKELSGIRNEELPELVKKGLGGQGGEISFDADAFTNSLAVIIRNSNKINKLWRSI